MNNTWSDDLIKQTRDVLNLDFLPFDHFVHFKNSNGNFGKISLGDLVAGKLIMQDKKTNEETVYNTGDELIAAGWAVD